MKRIRLLAALFCCVAILALPVTPALPAGAAYSIWDDLDYGVVTVPSTSYSYIQITGYNGYATDLTLPAEWDGVPVEVIALSDSNPPARLVIPEGVKAIRSLFGEGNQHLQEVVLPSTLKVIGFSWAYGSAFGHATSLPSLTIPPSVALIIQHAFPPDLLLRVEEGSYAHRWAKANEQPFEIIEHAPSVGDYDADGLTTSTDARLLLQQVAGKVTFDEAQAAVADVDGDGEVTTTDARLTLQYTAGKEAVDSLTCPLTFDVPLIPREAVTSVSASVVVTCSWKEDNVEDNLFPGYNYRREPGPIKNPKGFVDALNQRLRTFYKVRSEPTILGPTTGARATMTVNGVPLSLDYRLMYYGMDLNFSFNSRMMEYIWE